MRLARLFEALNDTDEFRKDCPWPQCAFRTIDDIEEFHAAHIAATQFAQRAINDNDYRDRFHAEMNKHGYFYHPGSISQIEGWLKKPNPAELPGDVDDLPPIREALDDKDEFHREALIFASVQITTSSGKTRQPIAKEMREISTAMGGAGYFDRVDDWVYNIEVDYDWWTKLEQQGALSTNLVLRSGVTAQIDAEMP